LAGSERNAATRSWSTPVIPENSRSSGINARAGMGYEGSLVRFRALDRQRRLQQAHFHGGLGGEPVRFMIQAKPTQFLNSPAAQEVSFHRSRLSGASVHNHYLPRPHLGSLEPEQKTTGIDQTIFSSGFASRSFPTQF